MYRLKIAQNHNFKASHYQDYPLQGVVTRELRYLHGPYILLERPREGFEKNTVTNILEIWEETGPKHED